MSDAKFKSDADDRLTRLCDTMTLALENHAEYGEDVRCVVFLQDGKRGGIQMHGYPGGDDETVSRAAVADVLYHLKAIFEANGVTLAITTIGEG